MTLPVRNLVPFVHVLDIRASVAFYQKLGFTVHNSVTPHGESVETWVWLECRDAALMLARASGPVVADQQAVLFYLYIEDVARNMPSSPRPASPSVRSRTPSTTKAASSASPIRTATY